MAQLAVVPERVANLELVTEHLGASTVHRVPAEERACGSVQPDVVARRMVRQSHDVGVLPPERLDQTRGGLGKILELQVEPEAEREPEPEPAGAAA